MKEYLQRLQRAFAIVTKTPGRLGLKKKQVEELTSQINHLFQHRQFEMNIFYGQPGMGKRSLVNAAIDNCKFAESIFYLEIDAEFTRTEYLFLNKIFNLIKAEDPFFKQFNQKSGELRNNKNTKKKENERVLDLNYRKDHAANFLNKNYILNEAEIVVPLEDESEEKIDEDDEEQITFKELDAQDANTMYSTLHDYFSFFNIVLYIRNAYIFTRAKRQSFIYNILEISRKKGCKGLIIFESQNLNFFESLEKRNASRMNPKKFVFGDFSFEKEFSEIVRHTLEIANPRDPNNNRFLDFLMIPSIRNELGLFQLRDFTLSQMLTILGAFLRQINETDIRFITKSNLTQLNSTNKTLIKLLKKIRLADEELHGDFKIATFDKNLCETEQIIMMIIREYYVINNDKGIPPIKVKNIENTMSALIKNHEQKAYKMTRELLHMSIENLQRIGMIRLSRKRLNLETLITADIDPCFSEHIKKFKSDKMYTQMAHPDALDPK